MLTSFTNIKTKYNMDIKGIVHIGGHRGQEYETYKRNNIKNIIFVEPQPDNFIILKEKVGDECILFETALGNTDGIIEMYCETENEGQSSSILEPYKHTWQYPQIKFTHMIDVYITRLDNLSFIRENYNFINIDVQGYELEVFKGGVKTLENIDYIYSEVNRDELYKKCPMVEELDEFLKQFNFKRVDTWWDGGTWGDALYIKQIKKT